MNKPDSSQYNRDEYAVRQTYVFTFSAISGAFGGLLAFGLTRLHAAGLHGWQWMYLVGHPVEMTSGVMLADHHSFPRLKALSRSVSRLSS